MVKEKRKTKKKVNSNDKIGTKRGKYKIFQYTQDDLQDALAHVKSGALSINKACSQYAIPKGTLFKKIKSGICEIEKKGPASVLTSDEELRIKEWIIDKASIGYAMHPTVVKLAIKSVLDKAPRQNLFKNNKPGSKWFKLFLKRHPEIGLKNTEILSKSRASVTEQDLRQWFVDFEKHLISQNAVDILQDPTRIFNLDETGVQLCPKSGKLLGLKKEKNMYYISPGQEKESITVLGCYSADGQAVSPMIVYPYKKFPPRNIAASVPDNFTIGHTASGWMNIETYNSYIMNSFYPTLVAREVIFPVALLFDGHSSHISLELHDFCVEKGIILYLLYPNATHITQPCDVGIFRPLKTQWKKAVELHSQNSTKSITKAEFAPIFCEAHEKACTPQVIKKAFETCGLYPFNPDKINYSKCMSTRHENLKKKRLTDDVLLSDDSRMDTSSVNIGALLKEIESSIPLDILSQFKEAYENNTTPSNETILFNLWKKYKDSGIIINQSNTALESDLASSNNVPEINCDTSMHSSMEVPVISRNLEVDPLLYDACDDSISLETLTLDTPVTLLQESIDYSNLPMIVVDESSEGLVQEELNINGIDQAISNHLSDISQDVTNNIDLNLTSVTNNNLLSFSPYSNNLLSKKSGFSSSQNCCPPSSDAENLIPKEPESMLREIGSPPQLNSKILTPEELVSPMSHIGCSAPSNAKILTQQESISPMSAFDCLSPSNAEILTQQESVSPMSAIDFLSPSNAKILTQQESVSPMSAIDCSPASSAQILTPQESVPPMSDIGCSPQSNATIFTQKEPDSTLSKICPQPTLNAQNLAQSPAQVTNSAENSQQLNQLWKEALHFPKISDSKKKKVKKPTIFAINSKEWKEKELGRKRKAEELEKQKELRKIEREVKKKIKLEEDENRKKEREKKKELQLKNKMEKEKKKQEREAKIALLVADRAKSLIVQINTEEQVLSDISNNM